MLLYLMNKSVPLITLGACKNQLRNASDRNMHISTMLKG